MKKLFSSIEILHGDLVQLMLEDNGYIKHVPNLDGIKHLDLNSNHLVQVSLLIYSIKCAQTFMEISLMSKPSH